MGIISDSAAKWVAESKRVSTYLAAEQSAAASLSNRSQTDWPQLRPAFVQAINTVMAEVNATTVGTYGTSSFGQFSATVTSSQSGGGMDGGIERFSLSIRCTNPQIGSLVYVTAHPDYTVKLGLAGGAPRTFGFADLLAGGVEDAVRSAVASGMR